MVECGTYLSINISYRGNGMNDRLADIQEGLEDFYKQLSYEERAFRLAEEAEKGRIQQKIDLTKKRIRGAEQEYALTLSQKVKRNVLSEPMAEVIVEELVEEIEILEMQAESHEMTSLLQQILNELQTPETPAAAKLKIAVPLIPSILTYEIEGDTEDVMRRLFPTFVKLYKGIKKNFLNGGEHGKK